MYSIPLKKLHTLLGEGMKSIINKQLLITFIPAISMLLLIVLVSTVNGVNMTWVTRDITAIADIHPLSGILSTLSILLWCITAAVTLFAAFILRHFKQRKYFKFLLSSSLLSTYLMMDDAFLIHEVLAHEYFAIDEKMVIFSLGIAVLIYLFSFKKTILETQYGVLILAFAFLTISVLTDGILDPWFWSLGHWEYLIEDGAKWLGIACWCSYYVHTSYVYVIHAHQERTL